MILIINLVISISLTKNNNDDAIMVETNMNIAIINKSK